MSKRVLMIFSVAFVLLCVTPMLFDGFSADISGKDGVYTLSGNVTLTEDFSFGDESVISINNGTKIDLGDYTMDFGKNSLVVVFGSIEVTSNGGRLVVGSGTPLTLPNLIVPGPVDEVAYSFVGTLDITNDISDKSTVVSLTPSTDDHYFHIMIDEKNTVISIEDPELTVLLVSIGTEIKFDFKDVRYVEKSYNDNKLISTRTVDIYPDDVKDPIDIVIKLKGSEVKNFDINEVTDTTYYEETNVTDTIEIIDVGKVTASVDENSYLEFDTTIGEVIASSYVGNDLQTMYSFNDISIEMKIDVIAILEMLIPIEMGETTNANIIKLVDVKVDSAELIDNKNNMDRNFTNIELHIDDGDSGHYFMIFKADEGDYNYLITATEAVFKDFGLTRNYVLVMDVEVATITFQYRLGEVDLKRIVLTDTLFETVDMDLAALYSIYTRTGEVTLQQIIDHSVRLSISTQEFTADLDGDTSPEIEAKEFVALLYEDPRGMNTLTLMIKEGYIPLEYNENILTIRLDATEVYVEADGSITECLDALFSKVDFTSDAHAEIQVTNSGFTFEYPEDDSSTTVLSKKRSESSPTRMALTLSVDHSTYEGQTKIAAKLNSTGYSIFVMEERTYTNPEGKLDLTFEAIDASMSLELILKDGMHFVIGLDMPWKLDVYYYDINFQIDSKEISLNLTHGIIDIDNYDYVQEGVIKMFEAMMNNNFLISTRIAYNSTDMSVYKDERETLFAEYKDTDLDVRELSVDLKRGDNLGIIIDRFSLNTIMPDGSLYERNLKHLDVNRDLSGVEPVDDFKEIARYLTFIFAIISVALIVIIIYFRIKKPHFFQFSKQS